jgi:hypothetical protein
MKKTIICLAILTASCCKPPIQNCLNPQLIGEWRNTTTNDTVRIDSFIHTNQLGYCSDGVNPIHNYYSFCVGQDSIKIQYVAPCKLGVASKTLKYSLRNDTLTVFKDSVSDPLGVYTNILNYNFVKIK